MLKSRNTITHEHMNTLQNDSQLLMTFLNAVRISPVLELSPDSKFFFAIAKSSEQRDVLLETHCIIPPLGASVCYHLVRSF